MSDEIGSTRRRVMAYPFFELTEAAREYADAVVVMTEGQPFSSSSVTRCNAAEERLLVAAVAAFPRGDANPQRDEAQTGRQGNEGS